VLRQKLVSAGGKTSHFSVTTFKMGFLGSGWDFTNNSFKIIGT
jgi:hypothetical protein